MFGQRKTISTPLTFPMTGNPIESNYSSKTSIIDLQSDALSQSHSFIETIYFRPLQPAKIKVTNACIVPGVGFVVGRVATITNTYNQQIQSYTDALTAEQLRLTQSTDAFLSKVYSMNPNPTTREVRNYGDWSAVKHLVIRDELMKIQIGGKTDLPITDAQCANLKKALDGLDLSNMNDAKIKAIIDNFLHPDQHIYIDALKAFKTSGKVDSCLQASKLDQLQEYLDNIDLNKITAKEFKYIEDNFIEKIEIHHRTSISSDPTQQSNIDNLDALNTTQHDRKHTDPETEKINYRRKLSESPLDRNEELNSMNRNRVLKENITGLGVAVAIGLGTGFAIGFIASLAENGINPNSIKYAFVAGAKQGASSAVLSAGGYVIGRTVGAVAGKALTECILSQLSANIAEETIRKISEVCNMSAAGALVIVAFSIYEFAKLKRDGYTTRECLLRVGKSAALSFSILIISTVAVWAGCPGIAVSIVIGAVMIGCSVIKKRWDKKIAKAVTIYSIELCRPILQAT